MKKPVQPTIPIRFVDTCKRLSLVVIRKEGGIEFTEEDVASRASYCDSLSADDLDQISQKLREPGMEGMRLTSEENSIGEVTYFCLYGTVALPREVIDAKKAEVAKAMSVYQEACTQYDKDLEAWLKRTPTVPLDVCIAKMLQIDPSLPLQGCKTCSEVAQVLESLQLPKKSLMYELLTDAKEESEPTS